jgi:tetratricopeptide (TPR) repeat protein
MAMPDRAMFDGSAVTALAEEVEYELYYMRESNFYKKSLMRRMKGYTEVAWNLARLGRVDEALDQAQWAIHWADEEQPLLPTAWFIAGYCHWATADYAEAETAFTNALNGFTRANARYHMANALCFLAVVHSCAGRADGARRHAETARDALAEISHPELVVIEQLLTALRA